MVWEGITGVWLCNFHVEHFWNFVVRKYILYYWFSICSNFRFTVKNIWGGKNFTLSWQSISVYSRYLSVYPAVHPQITGGLIPFIVLPYCLNLSKTGLLMSPSRLSSHSQQLCVLWCNLPHKNSQYFFTVIISHCNVLSYIFCLHLSVSFI
jgi:hypothetical protein